MEEAILLVDHLLATIRHLLDTEFGNGEGDRRLTRAGGDPQVSRLSEGSTCYSKPAIRRAT